MVILNEIEKSPPGTQTDGPQPEMTTCPQGDPGNRLFMSLVHTIAGWIMLGVGSHLQSRNLVCHVVPMPAIQPFGSLEVVNNLVYRRNPELCSRQPFKKKFSNIKRHITKKKYIRKVVEDLHPFGMPVYDEVLRL